MTAKPGSTCFRVVSDIDLICQVGGDTFTWTSYTNPIWRLQVTREERDLRMTSMSILGFAVPTPITRREETSFDTGGNPPRFWSEAITNAVLALNFENEQCRFEKSERHCAIPGTKMKLLSATLLQRLMRCVGFKLSKIRAGRSPQNLSRCQGHHWKSEWHNRHLMASTFGKTEGGGPTLIKTNFFSASDRRRHTKA